MHCVPAENARPYLALDFSYQLIADAPAGQRLVLARSIGRPLGTSYKDFIKAIYASDRNFHGRVDCFFSCDRSYYA